MEVVEDEAHEAQVAPLVEDDGHDKLWVEPLLHKLLKETCLEEQQRHKYCKDRIHLRQWNCVVEVVEVDLNFFSLKLCINVDLHCVNGFGIGFSFITFGFVCQLVFTAMH